MQVTTEYLDAFAIEPASPAEIPLNGWEMFAGAGTVGIDDPEGHGLRVIHWDDWPSWREAIANPGASGRWTLVTVENADKPLGTVGYEFAGLIKLDDLRTWYRGKIGLVDEVPAETEGETE